MRGGQHDRGWAYWQDRMCAHSGLGGGKRYSIHVRRTGGRGGCCVYFCISTVEVLRPSRDLSRDIVLYQVHVPCIFVYIVIRDAL